MKKIFLVSILGLGLIVTGAAQAKKHKEFSLGGQKKFKPLNEKIFAEAWTRRLKAGQPSKRYYPEMSNPVTDGGRIYVGTHAGIFYAVDSNSGTIAWSYGLENRAPISSTAALAGGRVYFTDLSGRVTALTADGGAPAWSHDLHDTALGRIEADGERVYVVSGEGDAYALSANDGHEIWHHHFDSYAADLTLYGQSGFTHDGGSLYVGLSDGTVSALDSSSGQLLWTRDISVPLQTLKDVDSAIVTDGDSLYVTGYSGRTERLAKAGGATRWSADVGSGVPPLVFDNLVIVADPNGTVYGLDKSSGQQLWSNELNGSVSSAPALVDGKIFVSTFDKAAYVLDPKTGEQEQKINYAPGSITEPLVMQNRVILLSSSGKIFAFEPAGHGSR